MLVGRADAMLKPPFVDCWGVAVVTVEQVEKQDDDDEAVDSETDADPLRQSIPTVAKSGIRKSDQSESDSLDVESLVPSSKAAEGVSTLLELN